MSLTPEQLATLNAALGPTRLRYCPWEPTMKQEAFLMLDMEDVFYGGAAGPGKSVALLMAALQYVDVPYYSAILFRRTYPELRMPGGLMQLAHRWLDGTAATWNKSESTWTFPSGATLMFGYLQHGDDERRYQSAAFQFIGFDEATHFNEEQVLYLFSRLRQPEATEVPDLTAQSPDGMTVADVPLRFRLASNPGGRGHDWVKARYIDAGTRQPGSVYLPARPRDNPHLNWDSYMRSLSHLPEVERLRLVEGDWDAERGGNIFHPERITWHESAGDALAYLTTDRENPVRILRELRHWDMAGTEHQEGSDPDWTVGTRLAYLSDGSWLVRDVVRFRHDPGQTKRLILATALADGRQVLIRQVQDPGSAGKHVNWDYAKSLRGFNFKGLKETGDKETRAWSFAAAIDNELVHGVRGEWTPAWLDEHRRFPEVRHDDQVDSGSGAFNQLASLGSGTMRATSTRRRTGATPLATRRRR